MQAKGSRPDEALDVTLKLPLLDPGPAADAARAAKAATSPEIGSGPFGIKLGDLLPLPGFGGPAARTHPAEAAQDGGGGHFSLRCGQLLMSAEVGGGRMHREAGWRFSPLCGRFPVVKGSFGLRALFR